MDEAEYTTWTDLMHSIPRLDWRTSSPCVDCPGWFADQQRAQGTCNGKPGLPLRQRNGEWPSRTPEYKRAKAREYRRRRGMVDVKAQLQQRIARAVELRDAGLGTAESAALMGVARKTIGEYLRKAAA